MENVASVLRSLDIVVSSQIHYDAVRLRLQPRVHARVPNTHSKGTLTARQRNTAAFDISVRFACRGLCAHNITISTSLLDLTPSYSTQTHNQHNHICCQSSFHIHSQLPLLVTFASRWLPHVLLSAHLSSAHCLNTNQTATSIPPPYLNTDDLLSSSSNAAMSILIETAAQVHSSVGLDVGYLQQLWDELQSQITPFNSVVGLSGQVFRSLNMPSMQWIGMQYA